MWHECFMIFVFTVWCQIEPGRLNNLTEFYVITCITIKWCLNSMSMKLSILLLLSSNIVIPISINPQTRKPFLWHEYRGEFNPPTLICKFLISYLVSRYCTFSVQLCHLNLYRTHSITMANIYIDTCLSVNEKIAIYWSILKKF